jgi:hypothetical protein
VEWLETNDENFKKQVETWMSEMAYVSKQPPQEFRAILAAKAGYTRENVAKFWVIMLTRGQRISSYANKSDDSASRIKAIMTTLGLKDYKSQNKAGYTVGKVMACFPEYGVFIASKRGPSRFPANGMDYDGSLPACYQHPAGFSVMPLHELKTEEDRRTVITSFMRYQNWYIEVRSAAAAADTTRKSKFNPPTKEQKLQARLNAVGYLELQLENPWDTKATVKLWKRYAGIDWNTYLERARIEASSYDLTKDFPENYLARWLGSGKQPLRIKKEEKKSEEKKKEKKKGKEEKTESATEELTKTPKT